MDDKFDNVQNPNIQEKLDMILQEMISFRKELEKNDLAHKKIFENLDCIDSRLTKLNSDNNIAHKKIFENLDHIDSRLTKLDSDNDMAHKKIFENLDRIDRRITSVKADNEEEHRKITKYLDSLNSAFIRYETDGIDKINILFDSDIDRKNHQDIYGHEFKRLNDLVAKNSFRISNLEKLSQQN